MPAVSPGVIVAPPVSHPGGGDGMITVVWTASQVGLANQAEWWVTPSHKKIPGSAVFIAGTYTVNFGPLAGYTAPPAKTGIVVLADKETVLTVTYGHP